MISDEEFIDKLLEKYKPCRICGKITKDDGSYTMCGRCFGNLVR